ncbi:MAG: Lipoprotein signal peptidase [candidate division TM6 bacterium GW2011_GWF2_37_49]|nr:MAG: Lipoprotein signal peptidase [candidate division TM6 bacterium GW2011_GWF2_37_49]
MNKNKSFLAYLFLISIIITLDQALKRLATSALHGGHDVFVNSWLNFSLASNRGISWGFLNFQADSLYFILTCFIILVISGFFIYSIIQHLNRIEVYFESLVIGGAISNVIDRINHGYVVDFIDLHIYSLHWPTFNVADIFIVVGVAGMLIKSLYNKS